MADTISIILISLSLSLDSFAVSTASGLIVKKAIYRDAIVIGLCFGIVQAMAPLLGWVVGDSFLGML